METGASVRSTGMRGPRWGLAAALLGGFAAAWAAELTLTIEPVVGDGVVLTHPTKTGWYYIVHESSRPDQVGEPRAIWLSPTGEVLAPVHGRGYYRIRTVSTGSPLDTDLDGIDDVFELACPVLDPMLPADALLDPDGDGTTSLLEYLRGRDPGVPALPDTSGTVCLELHTPLDPY